MFYIRCYKLGNYLFCIVNCNICFQVSVPVTTDAWGRVGNSVGLCESEICDRTRRGGWGQCVGEVWTGSPAAYSGADSDQLYWLRNNCEGQLQG